MAGSPGVRARLLLGLAFAALVLCKLPDIVLRGRFWAEEGNKFFVNAWLLPWRSALLAPWGGYLNLTANLAGVLAWHVPPLNWAPYAATTVGLLFQLCPAILVLTTRTAWLQRPLVLVAALLLLLTVPSSEEVWLSSIGTQCHLTLCAALILAFAAEAGVGVSAFRLALLALAALSGPGSWLLAPWFALRAVLERSWPRAVQAAMLGAGVLAQVLFFYTREPGRSFAIRPMLFLDVAFTKHVLTAFLGPPRAAGIAIRMFNTVQAGHVPRWPAIVMVALLAALAAVLASGWRREPFWLALGAVTIAAVSYVGALGDPSLMFIPGNGERYAFAPQALLGLALLGCAATRHGPVAWAAGFLSLRLIVVGGWYFFGPFAPFFAHGPSWHKELAWHRRDPGHVIAGWPPGWTVPLPDPGAAAAGPPTR